MVSDERFRDDYTNSGHFKGDESRTNTKYYCNIHHFKQKKDTEMEALRNTGHHKQTQTQISDSDPIGIQLKSLSKQWWMEQTSEDSEVLYRK